MSSTATSSALLSIPVLAVSGEDGIAFSSGTSECGLHHYQHHHHHSLNTTTISTPPCLGRQSSNQSIKHIRSLLKPYHTRLRSQKEGGGSSSTTTSPTGPGLASDPTADLLAQFGSGSCASTATLTSASSITTSSPFSPITPISSTSGYFQAAETLLAFQRNALYHHHCPNPVAQRPPPPQRRSSLRPNGLLTPVSTTPVNQASANAVNLTVPVFGEEQAKSQPASSPVVFTAEYLEARLAKKGDDAQPQQQESVHSACTAYTGPSADILNLLKDFPYASAYVDVSSLPHHQPQPSHRPQGQDSGVVAQAAHSAGSSGREEEIRKQKYAVDLIETAIKTIHKIWPETQEPEREAMPGPVTSDGKLRASFVVQQQPVVSPPEHKATARLRRKPSAQQFTPESSPDSGRKKRKRSVDSADEKVVKRSCVGEAKEAYPTCPKVLTPPVEPKPDTTKSASSAQQSHHISLKLFVRELLRRSKTSCNTLEVALCYLDGIEETVKKLRDCLKLGIAFGTVAMAERGPYDEGMKDEGRIITAVEWMKQEAMKQEDDGMDVRGDWPNQQHGGQEWAPTSPSDLPTSDKGGKAPATIAPTQVLATHPLLDARRTFLASLVLATKFIQDKAYSNKAWAKLSGLAGKEVGRCERALGGALQWRLWVGKDCGASSSIRSRSPIVNEEGGAESLCSGDSDSVVHGENDPLAKAFMEEASKKRKGGDVAGYSAPAPLAPAEVVARLYGGETSRAGGAGRARTWHAPEKVEFGSEVVGPLPMLLPLPSCTSASSSSAVSVASCSTLLDQLSTFNLVTPLSQASQSTVVDPHTSFGSPFVHSPLSLEGERFLESLLKGGEDCEVPSTVKIGEDGKKNRTPVMSMATSFPNNEPLPSAGFMDQWQLQQVFPFTFTAPLSSSKPQAQLQHQQLARLSIPKVRAPIRSYSVGALVPEPRLLHPQTAALRSASGSGSSPNSSSTFSSPEVLTPVHSRAGTLVLDVVGAGEQEWMMKGREFQQCVDQLYCAGAAGGVGQFSAIPVQM